MTQPVLAPIPANISRDVLESLLNTGKLYAEMRNGRWWNVRRNGSTKLWKTRPNEFRIPIKAGLKSCAYLDHDNFKHFQQSI